MSDLDPFAEEAPPRRRRALLVVVGCAVLALGASGVLVLLATLARPIAMQGLVDAAEAAEVRLEVSELATSLRLLRGEDEVGLLPIEVDPARRTEAVF